MKKGFPQKIVLIPIILFILASLGYLFGWERIQKEREYRRDQAYLASAMKTKLPQKPLSRVMYDQAKGYLCPGCCLLGASAGLAHFLESDIDFETFVIYSIPATFYAEKTETNVRYGPGSDVWRSFDNLGYTAYRGTPSPIQPSKLIFPVFNPKNFITFKDKNEEIFFIKKLLSAGVIPIVNLGDFLMVTGYENNDFWFSIQTEGSLMQSPPLLENDRRNYEEWTKIWGARNIVYSYELGYSLFWVEKTHPRKSEAEILVQNKKAALEAPVKIQKTIAYLEEVNHLRDYSENFDVRAMSSLSLYLRKKGYHQLADIYWQIAEIYDEAHEFEKTPSVDEVRKALIKTLPLYQQASTLWP